MISPDANNPIFHLAADFVNQTSQHIFLTGKAGTGKTTFLKYIRKTTHKNCIVAAPTGVAAINAGGVTLHSLFQLPFELFIPGLEYRKAQDSFKMSALKLDMLRRLEVLIIDEVSMMRADTLDSIDTTLRRIRRNDKPFGGVQMIYIGDLFQLPPVVKDEEWSILRDYYASPFFFHAKAAQRVPLVYLELKKVYRQREQVFVDLLNRVRNDDLTRDDLQLLNQRYQPHFKAPPETRYIILTTHNARADRINSQELDRLTTRACQFKGEIKGEFPEYALPTEMVLTLKEGAQVMFIKNDVGEMRRYFNGKLGTIERIRNERIEVRLEGSGDIIAIEKETWPNVRYTLNKDTGEIAEEELGAFIQYPIRLAWAITIHKSQGLTFERAIIDTGDAFAPGQAYVALSRCTSLDGIVLLSPITHSSIQTDEQAVSLSKTEKEELELCRILEEEKRHFWADRLLMYFDCKELVVIPRRLHKLLEDKMSPEYNPAHTLARDMLQQAYKIEEVAVKFQAQLRGIVQQQQQNGDTGLLAGRCQSAVKYFHQHIIERMLLPLQQYINGFKVKKAKTFHKNVCNLELDLKLFIENMKKVRYNDIPLINCEEFPVPDRSDLYTQAESATTERQKKSEKTESRNERSPKEQHDNEMSHVPSTTQSLNLFREGFSAEEIAKTRNISTTTVLTHLAEAVLNGQLHVSAILPQSTIDELMPWVQAAAAEDNIRLSPIKEAVGDHYSYSEIRLVMNHYLYEKSQESS